MNLVLNNPIHQVIDEEEIIVFPKRNFIEANTVQVDLEHLQLDIPVQTEHLIPV